MEVYNKLIKKEGLAIALGYFDGIHLGHKKLLTEMVKEARNSDLETAVISFDKNPSNYFREKSTLNIQTSKDKEKLIESLGVDYLFDLNFEEFKNMEAIEYLENVIFEYFAPKMIFVGYNHTFGKNAQGNAIFLKHYENDYDYKCFIIPEERYNGVQIISSSEIRKKLQNGNIVSIKNLLGRFFSIRNSVVKGNNVATRLGYPTANLIWPNNVVKIPYGVYFGYTQINSKIIPSLISWGTRPTLTNEDEEVLESHLYKFRESLYGRIINIVFVQKLREQEKFSNPATLKNQLDKDYQEFEKWAKTAIH